MVFIVTNTPEFPGFSIISQSIIDPDDGSIYSVGYFWNESLSFPNSSLSITGWPSGFNIPTKPVGFVTKHNSVGDLQWIYSGTTDLKNENTSCLYSIKIYPGFQGKSLVVCGWSALANVKRGLILNLNLNGGLISESYPIPSTDGTQSVLLDSVINIFSGDIFISAQLRFPAQSNPIHLDFDGTIITRALPTQGNDGILLRWNPDNGPLLGVRAFGVTTLTPANPNFVLRPSDCLITGLAIGEGSLFLSGGWRGRLPTIGNSFVDCTQDSSLAFVAKFSPDDLSFQGVIAAADLAFDPNISDNGSSITALLVNEGRLFAAVQYLNELEICSHYLPSPVGGFGLAVFTIDTRLFECAYTQLSAYSTDQEIANYIGSIAVHPFNTNVLVLAGVRTRFPFIGLDLDVEAALSNTLSEFPVFFQVSKVSLLDVGPGFIVQSPLINNVPVATTLSWYADVVRVQGTNKFLNCGGYRVNGRAGYVQIEDATLEDPISVRREFSQTTAVVGESLEVIYRITLRNNEFETNTPFDIVLSYLSDNLSDNFVINSIIFEDSWNQTPSVDISNGIFVIQNGSEFISNLAPQTFRVILRVTPIIPGIVNSWTEIGQQSWSYNGNPALAVLESNQIEITIIDCLHERCCLSLRDSSLLALCDAKVGQVQPVFKLSSQTRLVDIVELPQKCRHFISLNSAVVDKPLLIRRGHPILFDELEVLPECLLDSGLAEQVVLGRPVRVFTIVTDQADWVLIQGIWVATWSQAAWSQHCSTQESLFCQ